ncbi:MAG: NfeD family protein [Desulfovibrio sp.]|nr:NfeD family protein [Desulfovibrio sp.]
MNAPLLWFIVGVAFFLAELMTPAMVLLFFGVGAWASALAALLGMDLSWQIITFICISLLTLLVLRSRLRAVFGGRSRRVASENCDGRDEEHCAPHPLTGRQGTVSKSLHPGEVGEVSIDGSFWRAVAPQHIAEGSPVRVLGAEADDALVLRVQPVAKS